MNNKIIDIDNEIKSKKEVIWIEIGNIVREQDIKSYHSYRLEKYFQRLNSLFEQKEEELENE